jgi:DNA-binding beta-propeller fold protein YncE
LVSRLRIVWVGVFLVSTACVSTDVEPSSSTSTPEPDLPASTTTSSGIAEESTPAGGSTTTDTRPIEPVAYAVVVWEDGGWLQIVTPISDEQQAPCPVEPETTRECGPVGVVQQREVPSGPHNVAAFGRLVLTTHPRIGLLSRYDVTTMDLISAPVGAEPHDVKFSGDGTVAYVTDETGRRLITVDPDTLEWKGVVELPGEPHDLAVDGETIWVTLIGSSRLARIRGDNLELVEVGGSPHDLIVADGRIWMTHWGSDRLTIFDPLSGTVEEAPAGVIEPHHFAVRGDGEVWVSDNGGSSVVAMTDRGPAHVVEVGSTPHHLAFVGPYLAVAVSGTGRVAIIDETGTVVGEILIGRGLHGVAASELDRLPTSFE